MLLVYAEYCARNVGVRRAAKVLNAVAYIVKKAVPHVRQYEGARGSALFTLHDFLRAIKSYALSSGHECLSAVCSTQCQCLLFSGWL